MIQPERKLNNTAKSSEYWFTNGCVINAKIAVGPMTTSLQEPRKTYTKAPVKLEYSPYWKGKNKSD